MDTRVSTELRHAEGGAKSSVEETRLRILAAARELYARNGSRGTTTREVADLADVNEATVFRHFGTKQHLLAAMLDHFSETSHVRLLLESARALPLEEQLRALGRTAVEALRRKEDLIKIGMAEEVSNPEGSVCVWRAPVEARLALSGVMQERVEAGELRGDPDTLARVFMSLFFSYVMARKLWSFDCELTQAEAVDAMVDIFLNGARAN
ncbi:MAG: TetR/AcrR family transcriptional regulator [Candidatus Baltobacteraceae bacterium]